MNNVKKFFVPIACMAIVAGIVGVGIYTGQQVQQGALPWWPYPAFAVLTAIILALYGVFTKKER